jgi:hypothetical protein
LVLFITPVFLSKYLDQIFGSLANYRSNTRRNNEPLYFMSMASPADSHCALNGRLNKHVCIFGVLKWEWGSSMDDISGAFDCLTKRISIEKIRFFNLELLKERLTHGLSDRLDFSFVFASDGSSHSETAGL